MNCPYCRRGDTKVIDSRPSEKNIRRRRQCLSPACQRRFTTIEVVGRTSLIVRKKDGAKEPFDSRKIAAGLEIACQKRPITRAQIDQIVSVVEDRVNAEWPLEVTTEFIGEQILKFLRELDEIALFRFASMYRGFDSVQDFQEEMEWPKTELPL